VTVKDFEKRLEENRNQIAEQLRTGTYQPQPIRRVWIPKTGEQRTTALGDSHRARPVVQTALRQWPEPGGDRCGSPCPWVRSSALDERLLFAGEAVLLKCGPCGSISILAQVRPLGEPDGCGRSARPVRREGEPPSSLPLSSRTHREKRHGLKELLRKIPRAVLTSNCWPPPNVAVPATVTTGDY
jgi:hypothetical protein